MAEGIMGGRGGWWGTEKCSLISMSYPERLSPAFNLIICVGANPGANSLLDTIYITNSITLQELASFAVLIKLQVVLNILRCGGETWRELCSEWCDMIS